jgi:hypothetical protein
MSCEEEDTCMSCEEEDTCMSCEAEDTCMSCEEEDTCMSCEEEDTYMTCVEWCITRHTPPSPLTTTSAPLGLIRFTLVGAKLNLTKP